MKGDDRGDPALTKGFNGFNSWMMMGPQGSYQRLVAVGACMPLSMKYEMRNITGQPGVSIM